MGGGEAAQWFEQGRQQARAGDRAAAIQSFNRAVQLKPDFADAAAMLAQMLEETGQPMLALPMYGYALAVQPGHACAGRLAALRASAPLQQMMHQLFAQANALLAQGQAAQAEQLYRNVLAIAPEAAEAYANLSVALLRQRKLEAAAQAAAQGLAFAPDDAVLLNNLGNARKEQAQHGAAQEAYQRAVRLKPDYTEGWVNLGKLRHEADDHAGAIAAYEQALKHEPGRVEALAELLHRRYHVCRWDGIEALQARLEAALMEGGQAATPFIAALYGSPEGQKRNAQRWAAQRFAPHPWQARALPADARGDGVLRIGYVSSDYRRSATAYLISELFERHDRARFAVYAYCNSTDDGSAERARIVAGVDALRDIRGLDDKDAARLAAQDGIDILVDLKGYTFGHRLGMMAYRPAPLNVHYLGYPGTLGADFMDYFIGDAVCCPQGADAQFTEKLVRLAGCYQMNDRRRPLPQGGISRRQLGLPEGAFVFCDLNQVYKITPAVFAAWMRILQAVPGSVLMLLESVPGTLAALRGRAQALGVAPERLIGLPPVALAEHLERYAHADLVLDTFPVCGHTTSSDALWCGVPVLAMAGEGFASRVAASLLHAAGLPECVAADMAEYEAKAIALGQDVGALARLKQALRTQRLQLPLFDSEATTRSLESAFLRMAQRQRQGLPPEASVP